MLIDKALDLGFGEPEETYSTLRPPLRGAGHPPRRHRRPAALEAHPGRARRRGGRGPRRDREACRRTRRRRPGARAAGTVAAGMVAGIATPAAAGRLEVATPAGAVVGRSRSRRRRHARSGPDHLASDDVRAVPARQRPASVAATRARSLPTRRPARGSGRRGWRIHETAPPPRRTRPRQTSPRIARPVPEMITVP